MVLSRQAEEKLMNVLTFPGGWLPQEEREEQEELSLLREELLACTVLLLHSLLQHVKCLQLADLFASNHLHIYQVYTKQGLCKLLSTPRESALAVMEEKGSDAWCYAKV